MPIANGGGGGGAGAVSSVFTRTGAVVAVSGDYTAAQVTNAADKASASQQTFTGNVSVPSLILASASYGTTLPGSPTDGQLAILVDSTTLPTFSWLFRFNNGSSNTDKWECIGGEPAYANVDTQEATTSATYVDLATVGPTITAPRSGVYQVGFGSSKAFTSNLNNNIMSFSNGGTAASDTDAGFSQGFDSGAGAAFGCMTTERKITVAAAGDLIKAKYRINVAGGGNTATFAGRWIKVMPIRVS